jgi:hypothetical protein
MRARFFAAVAALVLGLTASASAQVKVDISFRRTLYMMYEPLICTVTIQNMDSRTLNLEDTARDKWFSVQIETVDGRPVPPINPNYKNEPMRIEPGKKLVRAINLTPLFPFEFGTYRVQATIFSEQLKRYFSSAQLNVEITEGRTIFEETVGVPAGAGEGAARTFSILVHRLPSSTVLYLRAQDRDAGRIYCTTPIGRFMTYGNPTVQFDNANHIHILQNAAPKVFLHTEADINGKVLKQQAIQVDKAKPTLARKSDGTITTVGGTLFDPNATPPLQQLPKLNDRPVPLPTPQGKPTPEEKRPENLLSR